MNLKPHIAVILLLATTNPAWAQPQPAETPNAPRPPTASQMAPRPVPPAPSQPDLKEENLFAPELIMQHQKALGLTEEQQTGIRGEMQKVMPRFTDLQWQQSAEAEAMVALLKQERPDEKEVLAQLDKLLKVENEIKRLHTGLLVRLKNTLTSQQQAQLRGHPLPTQPGKIMITGAVTNNIVLLLLSPGEHKMLLETILQAGPTEFARLNKVRLFRLNPNSGKQDEIAVDVEAIKQHPTQDIEVRDGDRIVIPKRLFNL
jgi:Spy/CpxP family protein refolding chaperone